MAALKSKKQPERFAHGGRPTGAGTMKAEKGTGKSGMFPGKGNMGLKLTEKPTKEDPKNTSSKKRK